MSEKKENAPFVVFKPIENGVEVTWLVATLIKKKENRLSCYMPGYNIYFSAKNEESARQKGLMLSRMFFDHFLSKTPKQGFKKLVLELHKRGFKSTNDVDTIHKLINNKIIAARFKNSNPAVPESYQKANSISEEHTMAVA